MRRERRGQAFPSARIKKIMQVDQDVGKIGSATPALVGKALECLIEDLLSSAAATALERRAKTVQPAHLKVAVHAHDVFDFLRPIFDDVGDVMPEEKKKRACPRASTPPPPQQAQLTNPGSPLLLPPPLKVQCLPKRISSTPAPATSPVAIVPATGTEAETARSTHTARSIADIMLPIASVQMQSRHRDDDEDYDDEFEHQHQSSSSVMEVHTQTHTFFSSTPKPPPPQPTRSQPNVQPTKTTCSRVAVHALVS